MIPILESDDLPALQEELDLAVRMVRRLTKAGDRPSGVVGWRDYECRLRDRMTELMLTAELKSMGVAP